MSSSILHHCGTEAVGSRLLNLTVIWTDGAEKERSVWDELLASQPFPVMVPAEVETICVSQTS